MLGVLRPHVVSPDALYGLFRADNFGAVVEECLAAHRVLELDELFEDLIILKVPQGLIFDVAIDVRGGHVRVVSTLEEYL